MENSSADMAVRIWSQPFSIDEITLSNSKKYRLYNLPFYYAGQLKKCVRIL